jgi:hypothetical protein
MADARPDLPLSEWVAPEGNALIALPYPHQGLEDATGLYLPPS